MPEHFTVQLLETRISVFRHFISQNGWQIEEHPRGQKGVHPYLIHAGLNSVLIEFSPQGGIKIWGRDSDLKNKISERIRQEHPTYKDCSDKRLTIRAVLNPRSYQTNQKLSFADLEINNNDVLILIDVNGAKVNISDAFQLIDWLLERIPTLQEMRQTNARSYPDSSSSYIENRIYPKTNQNLTLAEIRLLGRGVHLIDINNSVLSISVEDMFDILEIFQSNI